MEDLMWLFE